MFKASLAAKFKAIFELKKVSFDMPSETMEQDCLFVEVQDPRITIKDGMQVAKVIGRATIYGSHLKLPYGFFQKKIKEADTALTHDLFFYDIDQNNNTFLNIESRNFSFVYFYSGQYDPALGIINEVDLTFEG